MAKKVVLIDDISGEVIDEGLGRTVEFSFDGKHYSIDLGATNVDKFKSDLRSWVKAASEVEAPRRPTSSPGTRRRAASGSGRPPEELANIREWLKKQGHEVSDRGRVKAELIELYDQAHAPATS